MNLPDVGNDNYSVEKTTGFSEQLMYLYAALNPQDRPLTQVPAPFESQ